MELALIFFLGGGTVSVVTLTIRRHSNMQPLIIPNRKHNQNYITALMNGLLLN